jgi:hypothetical protein
MLPKGMLTTNISGGFNFGTLKPADANLIHSIIFNRISELQYYLITMVVDPKGPSAANNVPTPSADEATDKDRTALKE